MKKCAFCSSEITTGRYKFCTKQCLANWNKSKARAKWAKREPVKKEEKKCDNCSASFSGYQNARFCSLKCYRNFHYKKRYIPAPKTKGKCQKCSAEFEGRSTKKFCSDWCSKSQKQIESRSRRRRWRYKNDPQYRAKVIAATSKSVSVRLKADPIFKIKFNLRKRIRKFIRRKQSPYTPLIGCSSVQLREWLESKFKRGMAWDNYGSHWVVDHVIPLSKFNLSEIEQARIACHFTNLQPLTHGENAEKSDTILQPQMALRI